MTLNALLHYGGAVFCLGVACLGLLRDPRSFVHRVFAFGLLLLAVEAIFTGFSLQADVPLEVLRWQRWRWTVASLLPGCWVLFSLTFGRGDYRTSLRKWKWLVLSIFLVPLILGSMFPSHFFRGAVSEPSHGWLLYLDWTGFVFHIIFLLGIILIMMLLEQTLRASKGRQRWQVKFLALGIGAFFAARVYTGSQILLFRTLDLQLEVINAAALVVASFLILIAMFRAGVLHMDIYLSQTILYNSLTVLIVGLYFLAVGVLAKAIRYINGGLSLPLGAFFIFLSLLVLVVVLLSDRLRLRFKRLVSLHFRRPKYDYRKAWADFTQRTTSLVEVKDLCGAVAKMISEMFDLLSVNIWIADNPQAGLMICGSTVFSEAQARDPHSLQKATAHIIRVMGDRKTPFDFQEEEAAWVDDLKRTYPDFFLETRARYCIPLAAGGELVGLLSLGDRVKGASLTIEELDLLQTIADQIAASLLNLKLSEHLQQTKEMEAFQTVSAYFVHDLKNLASSLSMTLQNLPNHFDNPEFRDDALSAISGCVGKINGMCGRLSLLKNTLELQTIEVDLNEVVKTTLTHLDEGLKDCLVEDFHQVPKILLDPEQMQKVLTNLVLNAKEAMADGGEIRVSTGVLDDWVMLSVSDDGCGMSQEFAKECLFRPFKTTKEQGTGIGLFHSKMIVEAHRGRMEVESREGVGSTFRVLLPMQEGRGVERGVRSQ